MAKNISARTPRLIMILVENIFMLVVIINSVFGHECVIGNFEETSQIYSKHVDSCGDGMSRWQISYYDSYGVPPPDPDSSRFIYPSTEISCIATPKFSVNTTGTLQVNLYINSNNVSDFVNIFVQTKYHDGKDVKDVMLGKAIIMPENAPSGHLTIEIEWTEDPATYDQAYLVFVGRAAENSIIFIDSYRYIPQDISSDVCDYHKTVVSMDDDTTVSTISISSITLPTFDFFPTSASTQTVPMVPNTPPATPNFSTTDDISTTVIVTEFSTNPSTAYTQTSITNEGTVAQNTDTEDDAGSLSTTPNSENVVSNISTNTETQTVADNGSSTSMSNEYDESTMLTDKNIPLSTTVKTDISSAITSDDTDFISSDIPIVSTNSSDINATTELLMSSVFITDSTQTLSVDDSIQNPALDDISYPNGNLNNSFWNPITITSITIVSCISLSLVLWLSYNYGRKKALKELPPPIPNIFIDDYEDSLKHKVLPRITQVYLDPKKSWYDKFN